MGTFALVIAGAALLALLLMLLQRKKTGIKPSTAFIFGAFAIPLCILIGRGAYWICSIEWMKKINVSFWDFAGSGYSYMLYGAVVGGFAAAFLTAKISGESFGRVADAAAAPAALLIATGRFGEYLVNAGFGARILEWFDPYETWSMIPWEDPEPICRFPFAVQNYYGTWCFSINLWEGLAAVVFLIILLTMKKRREGGAATLLLLMYASCQILFESMRRDDVIIWGFVKANQLISALLVLGILIFCWLKQPMEHRNAKQLWIRIVLLLVAAGIIMLMEFALDLKVGFLLWMRADLCFMVMAACCVWMLLTVLPVWRKAWPKQE
jgi:prolipoprotein diacylglyceryltransferase